MKTDSDTIFMQQQNNVCKLNQFCYSKISYFWQ